MRGNRGRHVRRSRGSVGAVVLDAEIESRDAQPLAETLEALPVMTLADVEAARADPDRAEPARLLVAVALIFIISQCH